MIGGEVSAPLSPAIVHAAPVVAAIAGSTSVQPVTPDVKDTAMSEREEDKESHHRDGDGDDDDNVVDETDNFNAAQGLPTLGGKKKGKKGSKGATKSKAGKKKKTATPLTVAVPADGDTALTAPTMTPATSPPPTAPSKVDNTAGSTAPATSDKAGTLRCWETTPNDDVRVEPTGDSPAASIARVPPAPPGRKGFRRVTAVKAMLRSEEQQGPAGMSTAGAVAPSADEPRDGVARPAGRADTDDGIGLRHQSSELLRDCCPGPADSNAPSNDAPIAIGENSDGGGRADEGDPNAMDAADDDDCIVNDGDNKLSPTPGVATPPLAPPAPTGRD